MTSTRRFEDLVADIQTEISQLQSEWSAVSEYCTEVQQQHRDTQEELSALELEEKLLTKKLQELVGPSEFPELVGNGNNDMNKSQSQQHENHPWRILNDVEKRKALNVVLQEETAVHEDMNENGGQIFRKESSSQSRFSKRSLETQATILSNQMEENNDFVFGTNSSTQFQPQEIDHPGTMNVSDLIHKIMEEHQDAAEVGDVLQKQKEFLMSKMQQCGAVSVALDAMLLYRAPPGGSY